jgi:6-phosphofructokinase 1
MPDTPKFAILVGGGPAPGINSVISAATIRLRLQGADVVGIRNGFSDIMRGSVEGVVSLDIEDVSRIHFLGGSVIGTSRANPTKDTASLDQAVNTLLQLGVSRLITIGGDDTAFSAMKIAQHAGIALRVAHVPKTIDNDLALPSHIDTFGFQTARHVGSGLVKNLMVDAQSSGRWYLVVAMGRKAGHLALGIAKAAGATLVLIPEEFAQGKTTLATISDILAGAIVKRGACRMHSASRTAAAWSSSAGPTRPHPHCRHRSGPWREAARGGPSCIVRDCNVYRIEGHRL